MMKAKRSRALLLTVAEVDDILASLNDAQTVRDLKGRQRQRLQEVYEEVDLARRAAVGGTVSVPVETLVRLLRCAIMTQHWLRELIAELAVDSTNE